MEEHKLVLLHRSSATDTFQHSGGFSIDMSVRPSHLLAVAADAVVYDHGLCCDMVIFDARWQRQLGHVGHPEPQVVHSATRVQTHFSPPSHRLQLLRQGRHPAQKVLSSGWLEGQYIEMTIYSHFNQSLQLPPVISNHQGNCVGSPGLQTPRLTGGQSPRPCCATAESVWHHNHWRQLHLHCAQ